MEVARYSETSKQCYPEDHHLGNIQSEASKICNLPRYSVVPVGAVYCSSTALEHNIAIQKMIVWFPSKMTFVFWSINLVLFCSLEKSQIVYFTKIYILRRLWYN
jgi:hypothetical protein